MNVVIDTNIWISFLIGKKLAPLKDLVLNKKIVVLTSEEQIKEIIRVVERSKFYKYFSEDDINELIILLEYYCNNINIENIINDCRDSKDNFL